MRRRNNNVTNIDQNAFDYERKQTKSEVPYETTNFSEYTNI